MTEEQGKSTDAGQGAAEDTFEDVPEVWRDVMRTYGRSMVGLVMNAGMAGEAAERLGALVGKVGSRHGAHALGVLVEAFNQTSNAYVKAKGWDEGLIAQCERDIQRAAAGALVVPGQAGPRIVPEH